MSKRTTIKDIAQAANVSSATVSYILNKASNKSISEATRDRVLAIAQELHYIPNTSAQRLKTNQTNCIVVWLSSTLMLARYQAILQGIRSYLATKGYSLLLVNDEPPKILSGCIHACMSGQADGLLYISSMGEDIPEEELAQLQDWDIPVSVVDCMENVPSVSSVTYDYYASSRVRIDHLIKNGYRKFLYLRPVYQNYNEVAREQGVRGVLLERNDVFLRIHQMQALGSNWLDTFNPDLLYMQRLDALCAQEIRALPDIFDPDTAIIAYSRELQDLVSRILRAEHLSKKSEETARWYQRGVSYHFPHYEAGVEAARSLLNSISGGSEVRRLSMRPVLDLPAQDLL